MSNMKYVCSWQSGHKNTSWIGPGGGEHLFIYIYIHVSLYFVIISDTCIYIYIHVSLYFNVNVGK